VAWSSTQPLPARTQPAPLRAASTRSGSKSGTAKVAFSPQEFRRFPLQSVTKVTSNTSIFRFKLPSAEHETGLTVSSCIVARAEIDGKPVVRPYTPTSLNNQLGFVDLLIKAYPAPSGLMSRHIHAMRPDIDSLELKGPFKKFDYAPNMVKQMGMVAGGTGITPMLQVIRQVLGNPEDTTELFLVFANVTEEDILLRDELDALAYLFPNFHVYYTLDKPGPGWKAGAGYVSLDMVREHLPRPVSGQVRVLVCGPKGMIEHVAGGKEGKDLQGPLGGLLLQAGFLEADVFKY